jgi:2-dehydrotetronate isomerase
MLFTEVAFLDRFALAKHHGFEAVEFWFPYEWPAQAIKDRLQQHGLTCVGLNAPPGDVGAGDWGMALVDDARETEYLDSIRLALSYAVDLQCPNVHVMGGMMPKNTPPEAMRARYERRIGQAADLALHAGKTILIEPLNPIDRPGYFMNSQGLARSVMQAIGRPNVKVMFDVYHVQMTEGRLIDNLALHGDRVGHIQVADVPGRHEPGTGEIHWPRVFAAIEASGYAGLIGCEYKPAGDTAAGLGWRSSYR